MSFLGVHTIPILVAGGLVVAVLGVGGALTEVGAWYHGLRRPAWNPPDWLFGPAWSLLGLMTAAAAVLAWIAAPDAGWRATVIALFAVNAVLNVGWSLLFFKLRRPDWAFWEAILLCLSVAALVVGLAPLSTLAASLLVPYLAWVSFAAVLNRDIVRRNQPFTLAAAGARNAT